MLLLTGLSTLSVPTGYLEPFADAEVYKGGDVGEGTLFLLHRVPDLRGSVALSAPESPSQLFWSHDFEAAADAIRSGVASTSDFRVFLGYSGWGAQQLEGEVAHVGSWFVATGDQAVAELALGDVCAPGADGSDVLSRSWSAALVALGGAHARLARLREPSVLAREDEELAHQLQHRSLGLTPDTVSATSQPRHE